MALPHLITESERLFIEKVIRNDSSLPERDMCLWAFFIATPCSILEINRIQLGDVFTKKSELVKKFTIRGDLDMVGDKRKVYLTSKRLSDLLWIYITNTDFPKGDNPDIYSGFDPLSPLFITSQGVGFYLTKTDIPATKEKKAYSLYRADSLRRHIMSFMLEGGIESPSSQSGRRTFATKLKRANIHIKHINHLLGGGLESTKRLIGNDPEDMGAIAAKAY